VWEIFAGGDLEVNEHCNEPVNLESYSVTSARRARLFEIRSTESEVRNEFDTKSTNFQTVRPAHPAVFVTAASDIWILGLSRLSDFDMRICFHDDMEV